MVTRRQFIQVGGVTATSLFLPGFSFAPRGIQDAGIPKLGLFFDEPDLERLRTLYRTDAMFESFRAEWTAIDREADRAFYDGEIRYNDHLYDISRVAKTAQNMAFLYAMTGDDDAAALSIESVRQLMKFPRWDYFLEGGTRVFGLQRAPECTVTVSMCSDLLGNAVSDEERAEWMRVMGERGCEPSFLGLFGMRHPDQVEGWSMDETSTYFEHRPGDRIEMSKWPLILNGTNLKAHPAAALAIGAVAYERVLGSSEDVDRWIEQSIYSVRSFQELYSSDGSYSEGISYANYTSENLAQATDVLSRSGHADLHDLINWTGYTDFVQGMLMPTTADPFGIVNFGDAGTGVTSAVPFWVAAKFGDSRAQWLGRDMSRAHDIWSVLWYQPSLKSDTPRDEASVYRSELDWIAGRTGYRPDDLVVAMRSGGPFNHEHGDRNGLIVKCFGETLVADPYRPPYSYSDPSWVLRTTAGHSALLIDGQGHQYHDGSEGTNASDASANIVRVGEREGHFFWVSDATPAYQLVNDDVQSVTRSVVVLYDVPAVIIIDKVLKSTAASGLQARFYGDNMDDQAEVSATDRTFIIKRPAGRVVGMAWATGGEVVSQGQLDIPEDVAVKHPFVDVATVKPSLSPLLVTLLLPQRTDMTLSTGRINALDNGEVEVRIQSGLSPAVCRISDSGHIPEFRVEIG